ncbi:MAG: DUF551 domain-containing protein [Flavobacteriales bacterium]|nr:DUF551 domain-containing protein [Flavobacteriales bacterium]MDG1780354.1 DUF551 domain-containing protein [Flavobacteriales bacterium]MDG2246550.1 DUF551 domain-containing protein [Flavobacteriales bacterium]
MNWIDISDSLPEHEQRVLAFIPENKVYLPGLELIAEKREVIVLKFLKDFYIDRPEKQEKHGLHFWQGEGNSNHFFSDVTHWAPIPDGPA